MTRKLVFCGTPPFSIASLQALVDHPHFEVVLVVTQPDRPSGRGKKLQPSPIKKFAQEQGLKVISPESVNTKESLAEIEAPHAEACVVVAFGQILKPEFLALFPQKCVNVHGSLLPRWRGAAPIQRALMSGDTTTGVSLQVVEQKLDAGAVIAEKVLPLNEEIQASQVFLQLSEMGGELLAESLLPFLNSQLKPTPQDESLVTYASKIEKSEGQLDWRKTSRELHNQVRGLAAGPQAWTTASGNKIKVLKTKVVNDEMLSSLLPGQTKVLGERLLVSCGEGAIEVLRLQPPSKKPMGASDFLRGLQGKEVYFEITQ